MSDPIALVLFWVTTIFFLGILGRHIARQIKQPDVLGELLMGVLLGNICYFFGLNFIIILREGPEIFHIVSNLLAGFSLKDSVNHAIPNFYYANQVYNILASASGANMLRVAYIVDIFSQYGVIFLLFMVGLESSTKDILQAGWSALRVALVGVILPTIFGFLIISFFMPEASFNTTLFVATTLCATSIGITGRVLKDLQKLHTIEAKTILTAAMLDDIFGLILLALVSGIVLKGVLNWGFTIWMLVQSSLFFVLALWLGPYLLRKSVYYFKFLTNWEAKLFLTFAFLMLLAWVATMVHLAAIVGAFIAGVIIHDALFEKNNNNKNNNISIHSIMAPLEAILAPLFFMLVGIQVKLELFFNSRVPWIGMWLIIAAIFGKLLCGFVATKSPKTDRLIIGIGMMPRGEVGLVFAAIGRSLGVIPDTLFSAIVFMIIITTCISPWWLKKRYA